MNYRKHGLKALGLSFLAVLGLMAFAAGGAQASGLILVEGLSGDFTVGANGTEHNALSSSLLILNLNMEIFCHEASTPVALLTHKGHGHVTILFEKCLAQGVSGGALSGAVCEIEHITAKALALVILHEGSALTTSQHGTGIGDPYILFTPLDGLTFATVFNETECALPEEARVKGCVVAKVENPDVDEEVKLITTKGMLELFGCKLQYGANEGHLNVDALVELVNSVHGSHQGRKWGFV